METFVQESSILDRLPLISFEGAAYAYNEESAFPSVSFQAANEAYPESTGSVNQRIETLAILAGDAYVDRFIGIRRFREAAYRTSGHRREGSRTHPQRP
ncbi:hypothetical protein ACH41E_20365 [Streptomyces sp. NPDC020412]|uniref:hypothetical protein n=1 Tax=Streptomyces sp. NPDC020412 TaxID=3365073 RepID=UPI0037A7F85B